MGGSTWSDKEYDAKVTFRAASGSATFAHSAAQDALPVSDRKAHKTLDPSGVKVRESRDSKDHPTSLAIAVIFDVTGSMAEIPKVVQTKLKSLMGILLRKNYVEHPQIMISAVGDAFTDSVPIQVGQFESGVEIDNDLTNIYLEGNGGGQKHESYALPLYFMARHTAIDCFEKRGKKGYIFMIGDEKSHPLTRDQIKLYLGDTIEEKQLTFEEVYKEASKMYEIFFILPNQTSYYNDTEVNNYWKDKLGERFLKLEDPNAVAELIASTIGLMEGTAEDTDQIAKDLKDHGLTEDVAKAVTTSLTTILKSGNLKRDIGPGSGLTTL
jgi:hypothetical protein